MINKYRKTLVLGIIVLFISMSVVPSNATNLVVKNPSTTSSINNILYVGGSGQDNFTKIQDAIDNASDGDTVFVYDDSSPYYENLVIDRSINLIGENRNTTVIDGSSDRDSSCVTIISSKVNLNGFTLDNSPWINAYGVRISQGNENIITNNIITHNNIGIYIFSSGDQKTNKNIISNNIIKNCDDTGLNILRSSDNVITHNIIHNCISDGRYGGGIHVSHGENNIISYNDIRYNGVGIDSWKSNNIIIKFNNVISNYIGIFTFVFYNIVTIKNNNIYQNIRRDVINYYINQSLNVKFNGNYWGKPRFLPKITPGLRFIYLFSIRLTDPYGYYYYLPIYFPIPIVNIDWRPAKAPNDINVIKHKWVLQKINISCYSILKSRSSLEFSNDKDIFYFLPDISILITERYQYNKFNLNLLIFLPYYYIIIRALQTITSDIGR